MNRRKLMKFIDNPASNLSFLDEIRCEAEIYKHCTMKKGAACPIYMEGNFQTEVVEQTVFLLKNALGLVEEKSTKDYIVNGILLDESFRKSDEVFGELEKLLPDE